MRLDVEYHASAAHQLNAGVPEGHKCRRLHGHRYVITVTLIGDVDPGTGMLMEYGEIDKRVANVLDLVDHRFLNFLGEEARVQLGDISDIVTRLPIPGATIREPALAAKVRENSTVENLQSWFEAELKHHFPRENLRVGATAFLSPQVYAVHIKENARSGVVG